MKKMIQLTVAAASVLLLAGCVTDGAYYRSDVYSAAQVNQPQEVRTVEIIAVGPARVAVSNVPNRSESKNVGMIVGALAGVALGSHIRHDTSARVMGGLAGAALGSMAGDAAGGPAQALVDGVQLTFRMGDRIFNSAQVGRVCEFKPGLAVMVSPSPNETRIQPNNPYACPPQK